MNKIAKVEFVRLPEISRARMSAGVRKAHGLVNCNPSAFLTQAEDPGTGLYFQKKFIGLALLNFLRLMINYKIDREVNPFRI